MYPTYAILNVCRMHFTAMVLKQEEEEQEVTREESQLYEDTVHWPVGTKLDFSFSSWPYEKIKSHWVVGETAPWNAELE